MAEELSFSNNYTDVSQQYGTGAGFQFEFYCECCRDTWRSPFEPYRSAQAAGWLQRMGGVASSLLGSAGNVLDEAAEGYARAGWGNARDEAFRQAIEHAKSHFHRCAKCHDYACDKCFSTEAGLCNRCAPDLAAEVSAARHDGLLTQARDNAREVGIGRAAKVDVATDKQLACPECETETHGAKFCPNCGHALNTAKNCAGCSTPLPAEAKFCPECGKAA
jgi:rRNA maturation endonuclease Nob1